MLKTDLLDDLTPATGGQKNSVYDTKQEGSIPGAENWHPNVNVSEDNDHYFVVLELPGLSTEDVLVRYEDGLLSIHGEKLLDAETEEAHFHRIECGYGHFVRTFRFQSKVNSEAISAQMTHGVMRVRIPKSAEMPPRGISIN